MRLFFLFFIISAFSIHGCGGGSKSQNSSPSFAPGSPTITSEGTKDEGLQKQLASIAESAQGKVGVYALVLEDGREVSLNAYEMFAMQSVVKLPISMAVLAQYSDQKRNLDHTIRISNDEYVPSNMRSPLRDRKVNGITVRELIRYAVSESDGTAADVLQRVAGGASRVQEYINFLGIGLMTVKYSHKEFGKEWALQYENGTTPRAAVELLRMLWHSHSESGKEIRTIRPSNTGLDAELLLKFMTDSNNPANRLKGLLPPRTPVAHKTGTGGTRDGMTSATNDIGIITLQNGKHIAIAVFVGDSKADEKTREAVIAKTAKAVWDAWSK